MPKTQAHPPSAGPPCGREPSPLARLNALLSVLWEHNPFYAKKWRTAGVPAGLVATPADWGRFPLTTRAELVADQSASPPLGTNLTFPIAEYKRVHRSSGTTRSPLVWVDTGSSWQSVMACSQKLFLLAGVTAADRLFFAMPFTGSSGPWIMFEGACRLGCACGTADGGEAVEPLLLLRSFQPNVLLGKPGRLRALALAAKMTGLNPSALGVHKLILGGETATTCFRQELEHHWGAPSFDRYGLTEAGSVASECAAHPGGLHVLDEEFLCEAIHPASTEPVPDGEVGELVLTNLGRAARPIVRYRTGDLVRLVRNHLCSCGRAGSFLLGGVRRMGTVLQPS